MRKALALSMVLLLVPALASAQSFGKNKVQYQSKDWHYIQTQHFDIYFYQGGEAAANFTAAVAESSVTALKRTFKFELLARIPFLIYNSHNDFEETNVSPEIQEESVGGFTEFFKSRIVVPYEGSNEQFRHVLHHELTHAFMLQFFYGAGPGAILRGITAFQTPGWLTEGLAEYESMHWDADADNLIRDAVLNNYIPPIDQLYGFFAYKGGQNLLYWMERRYGRAKVTEFLQELRSSRNLNGTFQRALGENTEKISEQWHDWLKQWYWPEITKREAPTAFATAFTDHRKTSNFINNSPALSPDGSRLAYLSDRSGLFDIYLLNAVDGRNLGRLVHGQKQSGLEELKWLRPGISWAPDNNRLVFAAKSGWQDVLHIVDVKRRKIIRTYRPGFEGIWSPVWSPDGKTIAFSAMKNTQTDLYSLDTESENLTQLTNDAFSDFEPSWTPDGKALAFASDRQTAVDTSQAPIWLRDYRNSSIYLMQMADKSLRRLTEPSENANTPEFYHSPDTLLFLSQKNGISNVYLQVLPTGEQFPLTNLLVGAEQLSISDGGQRLAFTAFYRGGYDVYLWRSPLANIGKYQQLELTDAKKYEQLPTDEFDAPKLAHMSDSETEGRLYNNFIFDRDFSRGTLNLASGTVTNGMVNGRDMLAPQNNLAADGSFKVKNYRPKFSIDYVGAVSGYDPFFGLQGLGQLYLSDLTGNHQIGIGAYLNRSLANSDFSLSYAYQGWRPSMFFAFGQQVNFFLSDFESSIVRYRYLNVLGGVQYPLSRFARLEGMAVYLNTIQDNLTYNFPTVSSSAALFSIGLVRDNTRWGYYGPVDAKRSEIKVTLSPGLGSIPREFSTVNLDWRAYKAFSREWGLAWRLAGGASFGKQPQSFILGGIPNWINREFARNLSLDDIDDLTFSEFVYPLRGTDYYQQIGTRYTLINAEIRFPFIQFLVLQAPLPLFFQQVRGAGFIDLGSAWDDTDKFRAFKKNPEGDTVFDDVLASIGWGIRFYSPIGLLRIDSAWTTDLKSYSSPRYLFSLGTDF